MVNAQIIYHLNLSKPPSFGFGPNTGIWPYVHRILNVLFFGCWFYSIIMEVAQPNPSFLDYILLGIGGPLCLLIVIQSIRGRPIFELLGKAYIEVSKDFLAIKNQEMGQLKLIQWVNIESIRYTPSEIKIIDKSDKTTRIKVTQFSDEEYRELTSHLYAVSESHGIESNRPIRV